MKPLPGNQLFNRRLAWRTLAWCGIALGAAGAVLPLLPATPFLLLAAWAAPKGSPQLGVWLHRHRLLGPVLRAWREQRAVPAKAKCVAIALMASSWTMLWFLQSNTVELMLTAIIFLAVAVFLLSRPTPRTSPHE